MSEEHAADDSNRRHAITKEEYDRILPTMRSQRETNEVATVLTADEYLKVLRKPDIRPAFWKFSDIRKTLDMLAQDPLREAERRFASPVNLDTGELSGATPFAFVGFQLIHPGEVVEPHRHNSMAIYLILEGKGHTVVQEAGNEWVKYHWEKGDVLACPSWTYHAHHPEGDEDTLMYVVQDMPMLAAMRTLFWEEPLGQENVRHMVTGASSSWSVTRDLNAEAGPEKAGTDAGNE